MTWADVIAELVGFGIGAFGLGYAASYLLTVFKKGAEKL
jgi:mannitol-1-phosphate/altronate dehydrogenase